MNHRVLARTLLNSLRQQIIGGQHHAIYTPLFTIVEEGVRASRNDVQLLCILCHFEDLLGEVFKTQEIPMPTVKPYFLSAISKVCEDLASEIQEDMERMEPRPAVQLQQWGGDMKEL